MKVGGATQNLRRDLYPKTQWTTPVSSTSRPITMEMYPRAVINYSMTGERSTTPAKTRQAPQPMYALAPLSPNLKRMG